MSKQEFVLALDQGTTSSRAILFDRSLYPRASAQREFPQIYPRPGWVEHDPDAIWESQRAAIRDVLAIAACPPSAVAAVALANQRETVVVWNRRTGRPVHNAIVWQCRRTADACLSLENKGFGDLVRSKTGLVLDAYFSAPKIQWILDRVDGARDAARRGDLLCGTVDSWLAWNLSGGQSHLSDFTNASRTMLFDVRNLRWDDELLDLFRVPPSLLPRVVPSSGVAASCRLPEFGAHSPPLAGIAGDQQAALFGQGCFEPGQLKNTYGTGCFLLLNAGPDPVFSGNGLLTSLGAQSLPGAPSFVLEGSVFMGGAVVQWLRDELRFLEKSSDAGPVAASVPDSGGVVLVPAFAGLGAPRWDGFARGAILGMTRGTNRAHIVRAAEEAIAFQCADVVRAMQADLSRPVTSLRVDGGAANDDFLMQFQADVLGCRIERPACMESTALGAASLAALAIGWHSPSSLADRPPARVFIPNMDPALRQRLLARWNKAVDRAARWIDPSPQPNPPS